MSAFGDIALWAGLGPGAAGLLFTAPVGWVQGRARLSIPACSCPCPRLYYYSISSRPVVPVNVTLRPFIICVIKRFLNTLSPKGDSLDTWRKLS